MIAAAIVAPIALAAIAYRIDTVWFPVVGQANLVILSDADEPRTRIRLVLHKHRNCRYLHTNFFLENPALVEIPYQRLSQVSQFPVGRVVGGEVVLQVKRDAFIESGMITIQHKCHPLWGHSARVF